MNWFTKTCLTLFDLGLLPCRHKIEIADNHQIRRDGFMGLWSHFEEIQPALDRYLRRKKITYRVKTGYKPKICFWTDRDRDIYQETVNVKQMYTERPYGMANFLEENGILFIERKIANSLSAFVLFNDVDAAMVSMLCDHVDDRYNNVYYVPPRANV